MSSIAAQKLALHWGQRVLSRFVRDDEKSDIAVSVLMPLAAKDIARARISIPQLQQRLAHPIERFVVASPESAEIRRLCDDLGVDFVDEAAPLAAAIPPERIARLSGWLKQQFLKLLSPEIVGAERVVAMDSDTYPLRQTAFVLEDGRAVLYRGDKNQAPFHQFTEALIGPSPQPSTSFIAHCMLFEASRLERLRERIAERCGAPWVEAILDLLDAPPSPGATLAEYDLYGHFLLQSCPKDIAIRYYSNIKVTPAQFRAERALPRWKRRFRFVSNHERASD